MAENTQTKRMTAKFVDINNLNKGTFVKRTGWDPSGVLTKYGEISRVNLTGLIVSIDKDENITSIILDDGTGNISLRAFEELKSELKVGDIVRVVGKVRENNGSKYIVPEIVKPVSKEWYEYHGLRTKLQKLTSKKLPVKTHSEDEDDGQNQTGPSQTIINSISILDKGSGVDIEEIVNNLKIKDCEIHIKNLIEEGEVFEVSPGRVKLLE